MRTSLIHDSTLLSQSAMYEIDGCFYRFVGTDSCAGIRAPRYTFRPVSGQRRKADLVLNHRKLITRVCKIEDVKVSAHDTVENGHIQLSLF